MTITTLLTLALFIQPPAASGAPLVRDAIVIIEPTQSFQAALDAAPEGATIALRPGARYTTNGAVLRRNRVRLTTLGAAVPLRRVLPEDRAQFAEIMLTGNGTFTVTASQIVIDQVAFSGASTELLNCGRQDGQTARAQQPRDVTFSRVIVDGSAGARRGVSLHCVNDRLEYSHVAGFRRVGEDTQAVYGVNGEGPHAIVGNYLAAAGETIMFGGDDPRIAGIVPADITVARNIITKDPAWRGQSWTIKNLLELKAGVRVLVEDNAFSWCWNAGQGGYAVMLTVQSQNGLNPEVEVGHVTFRRNTFDDVAAGFNIIGWPQVNPTIGKQTHDIVIRDNHLRMRRAVYGGHGWAFFLSRDVRTVAIEYNTVDSDSNQIIFHDGGPVFGFRFVGNLVPRSGVYGITVNGGTHAITAGFVDALAGAFPGGVLTGSAWGSFPKPSVLPGNLHLPTASVTLDADGYGTGALSAYGWRRE